MSLTWLDRFAVFWKQRLVSRIPVQCITVEIEVVLKAVAEVDNRTVRRQPELAT
jgi:hypothetical protein